MKKATRKKPGPKPTGKGEPLMVRIQPDLMAALDKQVAAMGADSRSAAIRQILTDYFKRKGLL